MQALRTLIVDDEAPCRERLRRLLGQVSSRVEIVGEAASGPEAELLLNQTSVGLVFLDIVLPGMDGLTLASRLGHRPSIVFVTGFADKAVEAFDTFALHYLLKPVERDALDRALTKVLTVRPLQYRTRIPCRTGSRVDLLDVDDILYFQADHKYTLVRTRDGNGRPRTPQEHLIDVPLVALEETLNPDSFLRVSRSAIVNLRWASGYSSHPDGRADLFFKDHDKLSLSVSRSYVKQLRALT